MAIDNATKRFSMMSEFVRSPLVVPDSTIDQGDRQTFLLLYSGLLFQSLVQGEGGPTISIWRWHDF